ncbi:hypothetical protein IV102_34155, partial [bacterium]|nr:hypothetical protein [bacterium]
MKLKTLQGHLLWMGLLAGLSWAQPPQPGPPQPGQPLLKPEAQRALRNGPMSMNYENLDIKVLARIVSELTGRTVVLDDGVSGKVTLLASSQMTADELWEVFSAVLSKNGFGLRQSGEVYQVMPLVDVRRDLRNGSLALILREGDATQLLTAIRPLLSDPNSAQVYGPGKSLVLIDTPQVLQQVVRLARAIDRATPRVKVETLFLQYAEAERMAPMLQQVLPRTTILPGQMQPLVVAFPPTNALLIQGTPEHMVEIRKTVSELDIPKATPL